MKLENYKKMVELQHSFNIQVAGEDYLQKNLPWDSAIIAESGELLESYGYKWWKKQEQDLANVKVEAVDLLHFVISFYLDVNYNYGNDDKESRDSFDFIAQTTKEFERAFTNNEVYKTDILPLINMLNSDEYDRFETMKQMFIKLEMSNEDVYIAYIVKNCLNKFRQDNGYKNGTYIKDWNGKEDNVVAYELAKQVQTIDENLFSYLYAALSTCYIELEQDVETETLKNKKLNEALKNCLQNLKDANFTVEIKDKAFDHCQAYYMESAKRISELSEVKDMLITENSRLKSFNERKTSTISDLISQNIEKDNEISHLKYMIKEMKGW